MDRVRVVRTFRLARRSASSLLCRSSSSSGMVNVVIYRNNGLLEPPVELSEDIQHPFESTVVAGFLATADRFVQ